jgi:hypothetical protein
MGDSNSKTSQLNQSITDISTNVIIEAGTSSSGSVSNTQAMLGMGDTKISNVTLLQQANVSLSTLSKKSVNTKLQSDLVTKITAEVNKTTNGLPSLEKSKAQTDIKNIVKTNVSNTFSTKSLDAMNLQIEQKQTVTGMDSSVIDQIKMSQNASVVGKLTSELASNIISDISSTTDLASKTVEVEENPVSSVIKSVGDSLSGVLETVGSFTGFDTSTIIFFIILVAVAGFLGYMYLNKIPANKLPTFGGSHSKKLTTLKRQINMFPRRKLNKYRSKNIY